MLQQSQGWHKHLFSNHLWDAVPQGATHVLDDHVLLKEETEWEHFKEDASSDGHRSFLPALQGGHMLGVTLEGNFKSWKGILSPLEIFTSVYKKHDDVL